MTDLYGALKALDADAVLEAISPNPTLDTPEELTETYVLVVYSDPCQASVVTNFLIDLIEKSGRVPKISVFYEDRNPPTEVQEEFRGFFQSEVFEKIRDLLQADRDSVVHPENQYLASALLSGACMSAGFVVCSDQIGAISDGLQLQSDYAPFGGGKKDEIHALHACLHILMAGKAYNRHSEVAGALEQLKSRQVIKNDKGKQLLEVRLAPNMMY